MNYNGVNCKGFNGGLLIIWDDSISVHISLINDNIIYAYMSNGDNKFWISYVYGHSQLQHLKNVWDEIVKFAQSINSNEEWTELLLLISIKLFHLMTNYPLKILT